MPLALSPIWASNLNFISLAALLVKVSAKIEEAGLPDSIILAILLMITFVLPEPAPASICSGPSMVLTARACWSFKNSIFSPVQYSKKGLRSL